MSGAYFNVQTAAALADKVYNKHLIRVAKWVLVTVMKVDLWFTVAGGQTARLEDTGGHSEVYFLPARTMTVWRIKTTVTAAISFESHSHPFVFHLVVHLCISMVSARSWTNTGDFFFFFLNLIRSFPHSPQRKCACTTAPCVKVERCVAHPHWALLVWSAPP